MLHEREKKNNHLKQEVKQKINFYNIEKKRKKKK